MTPVFEDLCYYPTLEELAEGDTPIAIDTETVGACDALNTVFYYSWSGRYMGKGNEIVSGAASCLTKEGMKFLQRLTACPRPKITHNGLKADMPWLARINCPLSGFVHDTLLMHALLDEHHKTHKLKHLSREILERPRDDEAILHVAQRIRKKQYVCWNLHVPQAIQHPYAVADADDTLALAEIFIPELKEQGLWDLYLNEIKVRLTYNKMHERGILIDIDAVHNTINGLDLPIEEVAEEIYRLFDERFKLSPSSPQSGIVLKKHFPLTKQTDGGKSGRKRWKTDKDTLEPFLGDVRIQLLSAWRFMTRARSTLKGYLDFVGKDGRIRANMRQDLATGRSACSKPNLMSIPKQRGKISVIEVGDERLAKLCSDAFRRVRSAFIASPGTVLVSKDYSQVEYRCAADRSGVKRLINKLCAGADFHEMTCRMVFGEYRDDLRNVIKQVNYGLLYGMGEPLLITRILPYVDKNREKAKGTLAAYERELPEMRAFQKAVIKVAKKYGYVTDAFNRRYRIDRHKEYIIVSYLCQGMAANTKKHSLVKVDAPYHEYMCPRAGILDGSRSGVELDIHDELVMEMYPEDAEKLIVIEHAMIDYPNIKVPLKVSTAVGLNLLEMKDVTNEEAIEYVKRGGK